MGIISAPVLISDNSPVSSFKTVFMACQEHFRFDIGK